MDPKRHRQVRQSLLLFLLIFINTSVFSQQAEIGFGIGGLNYFGDLSRGLAVKSIAPAGNLYYRSNMNSVVSFRAGLTAGKLKGSDQSTPVDAFSPNRNAAFDIFLFEVSTTFEYHFLKWRQEGSIIMWTPYLFGGFSIFGISGMGDKPDEYSNIQPAIPFGAGIKYVLNPKWYIGLELGFRKTFFDYLDNVGPGRGIVKDYDYGNRFDNDHFYFLGLSLTYSFYDIPCPVSPFKKNFRQTRR